jgi:hypothetical protein
MSRVPSITYLIFALAGTVAGCTDQSPTSSVTGSIVEPTAEAAAVDRRPTPAGAADIEGLPPSAHEPGTAVHTRVAVKRVIETTGAEQSISPGLEPAPSRSTSSLQTTGAIRRRLP